MKPADEREEVLFREALQKASGPERKGFLDGICRGDDALRARLEALLQAQESADPFLDPKAAPAAAATVLLPPEEGPGTVIGRYKVLEKIGEGGFGVVYVAEQREPVKRRVALKIIKLGMDTRQVVARFEAERQALALMDHPNIAKVLDAGATDTGRPYFVMELVKGIPITHYCDQERLGTQERLHLFIQVCHAIQHAHQKGIIHRDIKPSNILVTLHDGVPVPKVIDFGIAKATQQELTEKTVYTQFQQFIGTPAYMSPEQAEMSGLDIDTRSDIYSLGVLLYELLTGSTPFDTKELLQSGLDEMRKIIREREPVRPSTRLTREMAAKGGDGAGQSRVKGQRSAIDTDLDWIVMKCLEKDRTRRYETANGLAMDTRRHLNHEPVVARSPSAAYRVRKFVRRNQVMVGAVLVVATVLVLAVFASTWQAARATRLRRQAEKAQAAARTEAIRADRNAERATLSARQADEARKKEARFRQEAEAQAYAADMNLIQQALSLNNLGRARELLDRHRPQPGQPDSGGWEWRYLWRQCRSDAQFCLCQQSQSIWSLAASRDGKWLAVGEDGGNGLSVWDLQAKGRIALLPAGARVRAAFSPEGSLLAFSLMTGAQYRVHLWDGVTQQQVGKGIQLGGECLGLAFSENGQELVTYAAGAANEITRWRVPAGTRLASYPVPQFNNYGGTPGTPFAVARDLSVAAVAPQDTIHLIDLSTGKDLWSARATDETVKALALSPDGRTLASGAGFVESHVRLWDVASGKEMRRLEGHRAWVASLVFWPDGKTLASASADQTIRLWDLTDTVNVPSPRVLRGHNLEVWRLALLADAKTLVSGSKDGSVYVWDTTTVKNERALATLPAAVDTWRFAADRGSVLTLDRQGRVARWKGAEFEEREALMNIDTNFVRACISPDGRLLAVGLDTGIIRVWDLRDHSLLHQSTVAAGVISSLEFLGPRRSLVMSFLTDQLPDEPLFHEWSLSNWQETASWRGVPLAREPVFSQDGRWALTYNGTGAGLLRDMTSRQERQVQLDVKGLDNATFSPDGRYFAVAGSFGHGKIWETTTLREVMKLHGLLMGLHSVAFSPDATRFATGSTGAEAVKLWDLESRLDLVTLKGQGSLFQQTAFSPDGNLLGSLNNQNVLHLWRAPSWAEIEAAEKKTGGKTQ